MIHVGIDPSLTGTGVAVLEPGEPIRYTVIPSETTATSLADRRKRLMGVVDRVLEFVGYDGVLDMRIYIEAPTYATNSGKQHDRSGLWWYLVGAFGDDMLAESRIIEVSPTAVKSFATGAGNVDKVPMGMAAAREFPELPVRMNNNAIDAIWLAVLSEYVENANSGRVSPTKYRDKAASGVPRR